MTRKYWSGKFINNLAHNQVFCMGTNPEGRHGAGAAKAGMKFGAKYGQGRGLMGNSYGLITKNLKAGFRENGTGIVYPNSGFRSVSVEQIRDNIKELYDCARENHDKEFYITYQYEEYPNGTSKRSLNGYTGKEMIDMFVDNQDVPNNIVFHDSYKPIIEQKILAKERQVQKRKNHLNSIPESKKEGMRKIQETINKAEGDDNLDLVKDKSQEFTFFFSSKSPFSQWHPSLFKYKDKTFISCEQFMMYCKAKLFNDEEVAFKILDLNEDRILAKNFIEGKISREDIVNNKETLNQWNKIQNRIKGLGREVNGFTDDIWVSKRESMVSVGNREKFSQNKNLEDILKRTGNTIMVEASPYDKIWGIGLKENDPRAKDPNQWLGQNLLGKVLTNLKNNLNLKNTRKRKLKP